MDDSSWHSEKSAITRLRCRRDSFLQVINFAWGHNRGNGKATSGLHRMSNNSQLIAFDPESRFEACLTLSELAHAKLMSEILRPRYFPMTGGFNGISSYHFMTHAKSMIKKSVWHALQHCICCQKYPEMAIRWFNVCHLRHWGLQGSSLINQQILT